MGFFLESWDMNVRTEKKKDWCAYFEKIIASKMDYELGENNIEIR